MSELFTWLFDLDRAVMLSADRVRIEWQSPYPRWLIATGSAVIVALIVWSYRRQSGPPRRRGALCVVRLVALAVVLVILGQPLLVFEQNTVENAAVTVFVDVSASMSTRDGDGAATAADPPTRLERAVTCLVADGGAVLTALARNNDVEIRSFAGRDRLMARVGRGEPVDDAVARLSGLRPAGAASNITAALLERLGDRRRRHAGIVLLSDGRETGVSQPNRVIQLARAVQTPIYCVAVGSPDPPVDASITRVAVSGAVFADDWAMMTVRCALTGVADPYTTTVRVVDERTGRQLAEAGVRFDGAHPSREVELRFEPPRVGTIRLGVTIDAVAGEVNRDNNMVRTRIDVLDRSLRVLYVESYPRYEYRYLKNALLREPSISLSCILLTADPDFAQEGAEPVRRFPETRREFERFDVILWGDVDPDGEWITEAQKALLREQVARRGCGFGIIAGQRYMPMRLANTPLAPLSPVRPRAASAALDHAQLTRAFSPQLTPAGLRGALFRFDADPEASRRRFDALPGFYWVAPCGGPRPGAEVLLERVGRRPSDPPQPIVVVSRYGAGKTLIQLTDDTWRWRRHDGELLHDTYWVRLVRSLMPAPRDSGWDDVQLVTDRPQYEYGDTALVRLLVRDPETLSKLPDGLGASLVDGDGAVLRRLVLHRGSAGASDYGAPLLIDHVGRLAIRVDVDDWPQGLGRPPVPRTIQAAYADIETAQVQADHDLLRRLAEQTGGVVVDPAAVADSLGRIPDQSVHLPNDAMQSVWDSKAVLGLFVLLLCVEWAVRRVGGMP